MSEQQTPNEQPEDEKATPSEPESGNEGKSDNEQFENKSVEDIDAK